MAADQSDSDEPMKRAQAAWACGEHGAALALWEPLAQHGVARAQSNLGAAFLEGRGRPAVCVVVRAGRGRGAYLRR